MTRATLGLVIGALSVILYAMGAGYYIYAMTQAEDIKELKNGILETVSIRKVEIGTSVFMLIVCLFMIIVSILLIVGIIKKRHKLMAPWVFLSIAGIILNIIIILISAFDSQRHSNLVPSIIVVAIQVLIWYPIYTFYKDMRIKNRTGFVENLQNAVVSATTPANTNYTQVSQNNI